MNEAWAVVTAALGASLLTTVGTYWIEHWRAARAERRTEQDRLRQACGQLDAGASAFVLRCTALYQTTILRSGITEGLDIALHHRKPTDPMELADWLGKDLGPMLAAQSVIKLSGNEELMRSAADVVLAAMEVLGKASEVAGRRELDPSERGGGTVGRWLRGLVPLHSDPAVEAAIQEATRLLGRQMCRFARVTREHLGVNDPEAVIRAFPGHFADAGGSSTAAQPTSG